jgi:hypothetical protein
MRRDLKFQASILEHTVEDTYVMEETTDISTLFSKPIKNLLLN